MNEKIINEFRFRVMWRIMQITEDWIIQAEHDPPRLGLHYLSG